MRSLRLAASAMLGYLFGTIPSADIAARLASAGTIDLRDAGSGNPGGANAANVLGKRWGYSVMAADIAKGSVATSMGRWLAGPAGAEVAGTASVIGHCWPVWNGFRGGKGVGCSVGQCLTTLPAYVPIDLGVAAVTASNPRWKERAFAATSVASITWVLAGLIWWRRGWPNLWGPTPTAALPLGAAASSAVILWRFASAKPVPAPSAATEARLAAA